MFMVITSSALVSLWHWSVNGKPIGKLVNKKDKSRRSTHKRSLVFYPGQPAVLSVHPCREYTQFSSNASYQNQNLSINHIGLPEYWRNNSPLTVPGPSWLR